MSIAPGTKIGNYEIQSPLGSGGMGEVYKAHDPTLRRTVAIKVLAKQDDDASARLLQETRAASALNHPHICTVYGVGEATPSPPALSQRERERPEAARPFSPSPQPSPPEGRREGAQSGAEGPVPFIVMEHVEGKPLSRLIPSDASPGERHPLRDADRQRPGPCPRPDARSIPVHSLHTARPLRLRRSPLQVA